MASLIDTFTDTDGVLGSAHTSDSGHGWSAWFSGDSTGEILDNALVTSGVTCRIRSDCDFASPNVEVVARLRFDGSGNTFAIALRTQHDSEERASGLFNHFSSTLELIERDPVDGVVGTDRSIVIPSPPALMRLRAFDNRLSLWYADSGGNEILALERDDITLLTEGGLMIALLGTQGQVEVLELNASPFVPTMDIYRPRRVSQSPTLRRRTLTVPTPRRRTDEAHG